MPHPLASPPTHQSYFSLSMPSLYPWVQAPTNEPGSAPRSNIHCSGTFNHRLQSTACPAPFVSPPTNHRLRLHNTTPQSHAHLTPDPAPLRAPGGGGAHDCTGGLEVVGRGSPTPLPWKRPREAGAAAEGAKRARAERDRGRPRTLPSSTCSAVPCALASVSAPVVAPPQHFGSNF